MHSFNTCRAALFFFLSLSLSANAETLRGVQRDLQGEDPLKLTPDIVNPVSVGIGRASEYAILAKSGISTTDGDDVSIITGNIGVSPIATTALTGFGLQLDEATELFSVTDQISGRAYAADYGTTTAVALTTAVSNMEAAYTDAAGRSTSSGKLNLGFGALGGLGGDDASEQDQMLDLGGGSYGGVSDRPLERGVYTFGSSVTIKNNLFFNGTDTDVFIIQISGDLIVEGSTRVHLDNAKDVENDEDKLPKAENIFWQVAGQVTVRPGAEFEGIILGMNAVTFGRMAKLNGRVLTQKACTLIKSTITQPPASS